MIRSSGIENYQQLRDAPLLEGFPGSAVLGEEGAVGDPDSPLRWVVDPIDGTVNFTYGIPHACVSIALQERLRIQAPCRGRRSEAGGRDVANGSRAVVPKEFRTLVGVVYDPFCDELWTARRGGPACLNGRTVCVSRRRRLGDAVVSLGFGKQAEALDRLLPAFRELAHRVRKIRILGAAALDLVYVATGRLDAYFETDLRLWDIAAGGLILECAGGEFGQRALSGELAYEVLACNGRLGPALRRHLAPTT